MDVAVELPSVLGSSDTAQIDVRVSASENVVEERLQQNDINNMSHEKNMLSALNEEATTPEEARCSDADRSDSPASKLAMTCSSTVSPSLNRKNKPPNLELTDSKLPPATCEDRFSLSCSNASLNKKLLINSVDKFLSDEEKSDFEESASPCTPLVTLPKHVVKILDAGIGSPLVRRSSRIEEILNLPDVKAAIVRDEGFEMRSIFHSSPGKTLSDRLQTPGDKTLEDQFKFECESPAESESISGSDVSSTLSARDAIVENNAEVVEGTKTDLRPRLNVLQDSKSVANPLERIADSLGPSTIFNSTAKKEQTASPKMSKKEKKRNRSKSQEVGTNATTAGKQTPILSRFKFSSLRDTRSRLEGWESLTRALARVGAMPTFMSHVVIDDVDLNPKVSPILKRTTPGDGISRKDGTFLQVTKRVSI